MAQMNLFGIKMPSFKAPDLASSIPNMDSLPKMEPPDFSKVTFFQRCSVHYICACMECVCVQLHMRICASEAHHTRLVLYAVEANPTSY